MRLPRARADVPGRLARARCWWSRRPGHAWETIQYMDDVAGTWAAFQRCVVCGRVRGLATGAGRAGPLFPTNPLAASVAMHGTNRTAPAQSVRPGAPTGGAYALEVPIPDGRRVSVRRARVGSRAGRTLFCVAVLGEERPAAASPDLRVALARAAGVAPDAPWVERLARQIVDELPTA